MGTNPALQGKKKQTNRCFLVVHLPVQLTARYPGSSWIWAECWGWKDLSFRQLVVRLPEVCCQTPGLRTAADSLQGDWLLAVCSAIVLCPGSGDGGFPHKSWATLLEGESLKGNGNFFPFQLFVSNVFLKESRAAGLGFCRGGDKL